MYSARSWSAIVDMEEIGLEQIYDGVLCNLAAMMAIETAEEEDDDEAEAPDISESDELIAAVTGGEPPSWWPQRLDRMAVKIRIQPNGSTPDNIKPHPIDPNTKDLSRASFSSLLKSLLELGGEPFDGQVQIQLIRLKDKALLGGWKGEIYVGEKSKKSKKGRDSGSDDSNDSALLEYLLKERERDTESIQRMFANSSNVIHASASAIQALRGANMAPPWMQGEGAEEMPFWMTLAKGAMDVVLQSGVGQQPNMGQFGANAMGQMMQHPVQGHHHPGYGQPQLPGPSPDNLGYDQYMQAREHGEYEGVNAVDTDLLDDDFDEEDPWYDDDQFSDSGAPFEEAYEGSEDYEYEDDEDEEDEPPQRRRGSNGNPLANMSPDELASHLENYIDQNNHKKAELKGLGMRLAGKLLK